MARILSTIPGPGVPFAGTVSWTDVESATVPESVVATGSSAPESLTSPVIINGENPGVCDEYW